MPLWELIENILESILLHKLLYFCLSIQLVLPQRLSAVSKWKRQTHVAVFFFFFWAAWVKPGKTESEKKFSWAWRRGKERTPVSHCPFNLADSLFVPAVAPGTVNPPTCQLHRDVLLVKWNLFCHFFSDIGTQWTSLSLVVLYFPSLCCSVMCLCPVGIHSALTRSADFFFLCAVKWSSVGCFLFFCFFGGKGNVGVTTWQQPIFFFHSLPSHPASLLCVGAHGGCTLSVCLSACLPACLGVWLHPLFCPSWVWVKTYILLKEIRYTEKEYEIDWLKSKLYKAE